jgi:uncharacterized protein YbbC (DUF1343 family)
MLVGLDVLRRTKNSGARRRLADARLGVLTHAAAVDGEGRSTLSVLRDLDLAPRVVFSPEHGLDGVAQAEEPVGTDDAPSAGARLVSLYGATKESLSPSPADLADLDVLVIDLVDVGSRYYTYTWTALLAARAAQAAGVHTLILDRPNPIGGNASALEGRPQDAALCSFVGLEPLPIRHSMTLAEIVVGVLGQTDLPLGPDGAVSVVGVQGWERHRSALAHGRPFVPPSPNMPTLQTALVYPGGCLLEGTNLSEGRGTTTPFSSVGAPFLDGEALARELGPVAGAWVRPIRFRPSFDKYAGQVCGGVMIHVSDESRFRPVETYLRVVHAARSLAPEEFRFLDRVYEFESAHPAFDLLTGTPEARRLLETGASADELVQLMCPVDDEWRVRVESAEDLLDEAQA